jgi:hydrogenase maturation protease
MSQQRILIAGIGNIFFGDDAFGSEVARRMSRQAQPEGVRVVDFGIRGWDLAYALLDEYDATILVDATPQGGQPGALYLIEPELDEIDEIEQPVIETHNLTPLKVLQLVKLLGGRPQHLLVVGCEPAPLESEDGHMGLSEPVERAVGAAITMIDSLVASILTKQREVGA